MKVPSARALAFGFGGLALLYRSFLAWHYYGWEEGDYGNLGLILGTVQSNFTYVETEHMPLYVWMAGAVSLLTGDVHTGGLVVALVMGALTVALGTWCAARWLSPEAGVVTGALLTAQPDLALMASTTLRTSTYTAFALATIVAAGSRRWVLAGVLFGGAFLTRFDGMLSLLPALGMAAVVAPLRQEPSKGRERAVGVALAGGWIGLWAAVYNAVEGHPRFWEAVVARNTASYEELGVLDRMLKGSETLWLVGGKVMPDHLGWVVVTMFPFGVALVGRGVARRVGASRLLVVQALAAFGLFCLTVLLSAYRWDHNLYWRWMALSLPFVLPVAAHGATELARLVNRRRGFAPVLALGLALATALPMYRQTWQQVIRSEQWFGTQVRIAEWADTAAPNDAVVLADLVPATWIGRRPDARSVLRWSQLGDEPAAGDKEAFGRWLRRERVRVVIWFREEWVGAAQRAPFLAAGEPVEADGLRLLPIAREDGYGIVAYRVDGDGLPPLSPATPL